MNEKRTKIGLRGWPIALGLLLVSLALWALASRGSGYFARALRDPVFIRCGVIVLTCLTGLWLMGLVLLRGGHAGRRRRRSFAADADGTAMVEFTLVLPIAVSTVLIMIQAMMMMTATVMVNYAAYAAARTAIVWVPADLARDVPTGFLAEPPNLVADAAEQSRKMGRIRAAAANALMPVAGWASGRPEEAEVVDGVSEYFSTLNLTRPNWVDNSVGPKFSYAWNYTTVELDPPADPKSPLYAPHEVLTVRVSHDYLLAVPWASTLFGEKSDQGRISKLQATASLNNEGEPDEIEEEMFN